MRGAQARAGPMQGRHRVMLSALSIRRRRRQAPATSATRLARHAQARYQFSLVGTPLQRRLPPAELGARLPRHELSAALGSDQPCRFAAAAGRLHGHQYQFLARERPLNSQGAPSGLAWDSYAGIPAARAAASALSVGE